MKSMIRVENTRQNEVAQVNLVSTISRINLRCLWKVSALFLKLNYQEPEQKEILIVRHHIERASEGVELFGFSLVERVDRRVEISTRERDREERERRRS